MWMSNTPLSPVLSMRRRSKYREIWPAKSAMVDAVHFQAFAIEPPSSAYSGTGLSRRGQLGWVVGVQGNATSLFRAAEI